MAELCLTVDLEEWYHTLWFDADQVIRRHYSGRYPRGDFVEPLREILALLGRHRARATFFVLKEIAVGFPEVVQQIHDEGHEIGSHGHAHVDLVNDAMFEEREAEVRHALTRIVGEKVRGFRAPNLRTSGGMINSLERIGYAFDSSIMPSVKIPGWYGGLAPQRPYPPSHQDPRLIDGGRTFEEVPLLVFPGIRLPAGAGWFLRNLGADYVRTAAALQLKRGRPAVLYVHPWEVAESPRIPGIPGHVFRRTGRYVLGAIETLIVELEAKKTTISEMLEDGWA